MTIILGILFISIIATSRLTKNNQDYLDKKTTNTIKGIFLCFVFISHFISYKVQLQENWIDSYGVTFIKYVGQLMVTLFLFYSGYGVMESIKRKGDTYIKKFPIKRILTTLINFDIAVIIYMLATRYFVTHPFSMQKLLLALIGWDGFGNSNWYIFSILILYTITYISAIIFKKREPRVIAIFICTAVFTVIMSYFKETYWYNTVYCYVFGIIYSAYKENIEKVLAGYKWIIALISSLFVFAACFCFKRYSIIFYYIYTIAFTAIIILFSQKVKIKNIVLEWVGKNLFPLYIFQRLPMILLVKYEYMKNNPYIFFAVALVITVIITFVYNYTMHAKDKIIQRLCKKSNNL